MSRAPVAFDDLFAEAQKPAQPVSFDDLFAEASRARPSGTSAGRLAAQVGIGAAHEVLKSPDRALALWEMTRPDPRTEPTFSERAAQITAPIDAQQAAEVLYGRGAAFPAYQRPVQPIHPIESGLRAMTLSNELLAGRAGMNDLANEPRNMAERVARGVGSGAVQVGAATVLGAATAGAGTPAALAVFAGTAAAPVVADTYREALRETGDHRRAEREAESAGAVTFLTSFFPGAAILRRTPMGSALVRTAARAAAGRMGGIAAAAGAEGTQEYAEGFAQEIATRVMRRDERLTKAMVYEALTNPQRAEEFIVGGLVGGAAHAPLAFAPSRHGASQAVPPGVQDLRPLQAFPGDLRPAFPQGADGGAETTPRTRPDVPNATSQEAGSPAVPGAEPGTGVRVAEADVVAQPSEDRTRAEEEADAKLREYVAMVVAGEGETDPETPGQRHADAPTPNTAPQSVSSLPADADPREQDASVAPDQSAGDPPDTTSEVSSPSPEGTRYAPPVAAQDGAGRSAQPPQPPERPSANTLTEIAERHRKSGQTYNIRQARADAQAAGFTIAELNSEIRRQAEENRARKQAASEANAQQREAQRFADAQQREADAQELADYLGVSKERAKDDVYAEAAPRIVSEAVQRGGWKIDHESGSGSYYLMHEASGEIVRFSNHSVPQTAERDDNKSRGAVPWDGQEVIVGRRDGIRSVRAIKAAADSLAREMDKVERRHAEESETDPSAPDQPGGDSARTPQPPGESAASQPQEAPDGQEGNQGRQGRQEGLLNETPATPEGTRGDLASRLDKVAEDALERIRKRRIPRGPRTGGDTLGADILDAGIFVAAKVGSKGLKTVGAVNKAVNAAIAEHFPDLKKKAGDVRAVAVGILRKSRNEDGAFDESKWEASLADIETKRNAPDQPVKTRVNRATGVKKDKPKTVSASDALVASLRAEERGSRKGYRVGVREGVARVKAQLPALHAQMRRAGDLKALRAAITERGKGAVKLDIEQARAAVAKGIRNEVLRLVRENVPKAMQPRFLGAIAQADTLPKLNAAIGRMRHAVADFEVADARRLAQRIAKRAGQARRLRFMFDEHRKALVHAIAEVARLRAAIPEAKTVEAKEALAADLRAQIDAMRQAVHQDREDRKVRLGQQILEREAVVAEITRGIETNRKAIEATLEGLPKEMRAGKLQAFHHAHLTPDVAGSALGGGKARELLSEQFWDGQAAISKGVFEAQDALKAWVKEAGLEWGSDKLQRMSAVVSGDDAEIVTLDLPTAGKVKTTKAEMMALYATLTDGGAGPQIEDGVPITFKRDPRADGIVLRPADVRHLYDQLGDDLQAVVDRAKAWVEANRRKGVFATFRQLNGFDLDPVRGYWRTRRNLKQRATPKIDEVVRPGGSDAAFRESLLSLGFLKDRVPEAKTPYVIGDFFEDFQDIVYQSLVFEHMAPKVRAAQQVFGDKRVAKAIHDHFGEDMNKQVGRAIANAQLLFVEPRTGFEKAAAYLNRNMARALLTTNHTTMLKQIGGVFKLAPYIDAKYLVPAARKMFDRETRAEMMQSAHARDRYESAIWRRVSPTQGERLPLLGASNLKDVLRRLPTKRFAGALGDLVDRIEWLNFFDKAVYATAWEAKRLEAKDRGIAAHDQRAFIERGVMQAIERSQNTHTALSMSGFAADHRGNPLASAFIMFSSDSNKAYNMIADAAYSGDAAKVRRAAAAVALNNAWASTVTALVGKRGLLTGAAGAALYFMLHGEWPDDEDKKRTALWERWGRQFLRDSAGAAYGGGELADIVMRVIDAVSGEARPHDVLNTPVADALEEVIAGIEKLGQAAGAGDARFETGPRRGKSKRWGYLGDAMESLALGASKVFGIPLPPFWNLVQSLRDAAR